MDLRGHFVAEDGHGKETGTGKRDEDGGEGLNIEKEKEAKLCLGYRISISTDLINYVTHFQWPLYDTFQSHDTGVFYQCIIIIIGFII